MLTVIGCLVGGAVVVGWPARVRPAFPGRIRRPVLPSIDPAIVADVLLRQPRRLILVVGGVAGVAGWIAAGPVAALTGAVYGALGGRAAVRHSTGRREAAERSRSLDDLSALAADLRAGLPPA